MVGRARAARRA